MEGLLDQAVHLLRYYTGLPKPPLRSRVIGFSSEREFVELLHSGQPVAVAFTFKCEHTKHFDEMFARASEEFYPQVLFVRVECPSHLGFCISRQRKDFPFIEIFHSREAQLMAARKDAGDGVTRYSVSVTPYNYDVSPYGFRKFFHKHGILFTES